MYGKQMKLETLAVHIGRGVEEGTGAVTPSIVPAVTFERAPDYSDPPDQPTYSRISNPNRLALEKALAAIEGGQTAFAFGSGMAAITAVMQSLGTGDHVIVPDDMYVGLRELVNKVLPRWGLHIDQVDMSEPKEVWRATRPTTKLIWVESPSNPGLKITDIAAIVEIAHEAGALCGVDNTWATSIWQRPLELGADLVMHATTKYVGGHSDVLGGCLIINQPEESELGQRLRTLQKLGGGVPSPFDCWLLLRSLPTMPARVRMQTENAMRIADFLHDHPKVSVVRYPGLHSHPGHAVAARQMRGYGAMLSFEVVGGREAALAVAASVKLITRATSLGGVESLIEHRVSVEGPDSPTPPGLLRLSVGLEHIDDLIEDLAQALG
jgi:cystathionine gamma-synthase